MNASSCFGRLSDNTARSSKGSSKRGVSSPRTRTRQKMSKFSAVGGKVGLSGGGDIFGTDGV